MRWPHLLLATTAGAMMAPALHAARLQFSTGTEYFKGDFGELTSTEVLVVPFAARVSFGGLSLRASLPWLSIRGPADIAPLVDDAADRGAAGGDGTSGPNPKAKEKAIENGKGPGRGGVTAAPELAALEEPDVATDRMVQGMGDAALSAAWSFRDIGGTLLYLDVTGRVRLPTGDETRGLGRGTTDYATLAELGWDGTWGGVFALGGRQYLESTATVKRRDVWQSSAGGWVNFGRASLIGVQGTWRQSSMTAGVSSRSVEAFLNLGVASGWRLDASASAGLGRFNPDYSICVGITWKSARF
jgi:hypothetical protein